MPGASIADPALEEEQLSITSVASVDPTPETVSKIVNRIRALILELLPVEVDSKDLTQPSGRIITGPVVKAFQDAAGDFSQALPWCLLRARVEFLYEANHNPADYDENFGRAVACEVIARRIIHFSPPETHASLLSSRFRRKQLDGDLSDFTNALEMAIDSNCTIFLSSSEAQDVVQALWKGDLVQTSYENRDVKYEVYQNTHRTGFWDHLSPNRLSVPRYQNIFRIIVWLLFLIIYSQAVEVPVDELNTPRSPLDEWEIVMYIMSFAFFIEDFHQLYKLLLWFSWRAFGFWSLVNLVTDCLLLAAFVLRVVGLSYHGDKSAALRTNSFQVLSFVGPLIWMKLLRVFDGYKYVGTMQICVARMLRESGIFFALLSILALGFYQGLWALDLADGVADNPSRVANVLIQALLQSPAFDKFEHSPWGLWLYYFWNVVTAIILLNVLISLFSSAYDDVVHDAEGQYSAFFAHKTVGMIRAPDTFLYPAPFNLIEAFLIAPLELCGLPSKLYARINRVIMGSLFFIPLCVIALYETTLHSKVEPWLRGDDQGIEDLNPSRNPTTHDEDGRQITKVSFEDLVNVFPDCRVSPEEKILLEVKTLREDVAELKALLLKLQNCPSE